MKNLQYRHSNNGNKLQFWHSTNENYVQFRQSIACNICNFYSFDTRMLEIIHNCRTCLIKNECSSDTHLKKINLWKIFADSAIRHIIDKNYLQFRHFRAIDTHMMENICDSNTRIMRIICYQVSNLTDEICLVPKVGLQFQHFRHCNFYYFCKKSRILIIDC